MHKVISKFKALTLCVYRGEFIFITSVNIKEIFSFIILYNQNSTLYLHISELKKIQAYFPS
jgi:hypothetical protein